MIDYDPVKYVFAYRCEPGGVVVLKKKRQIVAISLCLDPEAGIGLTRFTVGIRQGNFKVNRCPVRAYP